MLLPTVANRYGFFYALGNTPATNLTRSLPHGQNATILSLGCGDVRNILYTAYNEIGLPSRKLDITCCDIDERVLARNIILFTLIIDSDEAASADVLWEIYYHIYLDRPATDILAKQAKKLLPLLASLQEWEAGPYAQFFRFCDEVTVTDVHRMLSKVHDGTEQIDSSAYRAQLSSHLKLAVDLRKAAFGGNDGTVYTAIRSAAPLGMSASKSVPKAYEQFWKNGTATPVTLKEQLPNPMFASLASEESVLRYGSDPIMGFHLATAFAPLTTSSPLNDFDAHGDWAAANAAKNQFSEWVSAFRKIYKRMVVRFVVADAFSFCHTLQHAAASSETTANWYRRQWDLKVLKLDAKAYGRTGADEKPVLFDMVDSSNLADHFGALNILVAAVPLLKAHPWAAVYTDLLIQGEGSPQAALTKVLKGHLPTISLLLGIIPIQHWTNAKCESHVDEIMLGLFGGQAPRKQAHSSLLWKRDDQISGMAGQQTKLQIKSDALARIILSLYLQMFDIERIQAPRDSPDVAYPHFHRGSFAAMLRLVMHRVETDWFEMCNNLLDNIGRDQNLALGSNYIQELLLQLHLANVVDGSLTLQVMRPHENSGPFRSWKHIPPVVAVTIVIPPSAFSRLYQGESRKMASPTLVGSLRSSPSGNSQWHNMYGDVHIAWGTVRSQSEESRGESGLDIDEDESGWSGSSHVIASFMVTAAALQLEPETVIVGINVPPTGQNPLIYGSILGLSMTVFETTIANGSQVYVSKYMPRQCGHRIVTGGAKSFKSRAKDGDTKLSVEIPSSESNMVTVTGHLDIVSKQGKKLLEQKAAIEFRQKDPFTIEVVFDEGKLTYPLRFPVPVTTEGRKVRVARTSGYVEIIAPLATNESQCLEKYLFPTKLDAQGIPSALNMSHLNLERLPILDLEKPDQLSWLTTLCSFQFTPREKAMRDEANAGTGPRADVRVNFKDSLFTLFMLSSGLQGGQTGLFAINHPDRGGIQMLILVSAIRLDCAAASVVLDAAVLALTMDQILSGQMEDFLLVLRTLQLCTVQVNDEELELWKRVLPSMVERCRTWEHKSNCEYKRKGQAPISFGHGEQVICSCGNGKLPKGYMSLPEWDQAAPYATRIAISPTYAVPSVEEVADTSMLKTERATSTKPKCRNCGKTEATGGGDLKKCMRCQRVRYCSGDCQKKDWKKHRMECKEQ